MSENITIQESGVGKQLSVDKLQFNVPGSAHATMVPLDNTRKKYAILHTKTNGTFNAAKFHLDGFLSVIADVQSGHYGDYSVKGETYRYHKKVSTITIQEGGNGYSFGPIDAVAVDLQGGGTLDFVEPVETSIGSKSISANGLYTADSDDLDAYSEVTVEIEDGSGDDGKVEPSICGNIETEIPYTTSFLMTVRVYDDDGSPDTHYLSVWNDADDARVFGIYNSTSDTITWYWVAKAQFSVHRTKTLVQGSNISTTEDSLSGSGITVDGKYVYYVSYTSNNIYQLSYYNAPILTDVESPNNCDLYAVAYG